MANIYYRAPLFAGTYAGYCGCIVIINNESKYLPLTQVSARATLLASTSHTTLTQTFKNPTSQTLKESRYVFPLFDGVSVVAFTCTIGDTVIQGLVKSKPEAKKEFDAAVAQGQRAGLFEQSDKASDVFTTMLGNVGPNEEAKVEITFLGELKHDAEVDGLRYTIPMHIAPRYAEDLVLNLPTTHSNVLTAEAGMTVTVDVDMATGAAIKSVQSPSHPISVNIGTTSTRPNDDPSLQYASASISRSDVQLDKDFIIQVCAKGLGDPSAVIETHPTIPNRQAIMATLVPRFSLSVEKPEVVFICDRSGSMGTGTRLPNLVAALQVFLKSLPVGVLFNICSFGSSHSFLWPKSQPYTQATLDAATAHVKTFDANYGGTQMREPIEAVFSNRETSRNLEVFLMTDGETWDQAAVLEVVNTAVKTSKGAIRVFSLGVGNDVSHSLIEGAARAGQGFAQSVGENEKMDKKVVRMLKGALTPHITDYSLGIKYEKEDDDEFELVEKVRECTVVDSVEAVPATTAKPSISLHDTSVKDEDLEMPDAKALPLPDLPTPAYLQAPYNIPPLFPFNRTSVYILLSESHNVKKVKSVLLKGTAPQGPLELEIPITALTDKGTTIHQLAARKAVQDLEEGRGWVYDAKLNSGKPLADTYAMQMTDVAREAGIKLGVEYQVAGKWCSFVAVQKSGSEPAKEISKPVAQVLEGDDLEESEEEEEAMGFSFAGHVSPPQPQKRKMPARGPFAARKSAPSRPPPPPAPISAARTSSVRHRMMDVGGSVHSRGGFGGSSAATTAAAALPPGGAMFGMAQPTGSSSSFGGSSSLFSTQQRPMFQQPTYQQQAQMSAAGGRDSQLLAQMHQQQQQQQQQQRQSSAFGQPRPQVYSTNEFTDRGRTNVTNSFGFDTALDFSLPTPCEDAEDVDVLKHLTPLEAIISLQTFSGSWAWTPQLERLLGVTQEKAMAALSSTTSLSEVVATLCAIAYLQSRLADEAEVWELMVDKARDWLADALSLEEDDIKALDTKAQQILG